MDRALPDRMPELRPRQNSHIVCRAGLDPQLIWSVTALDFASNFVLQANPLDTS